MNALNNLTSIAQVLGADRTRSELLPYISGKLEMTTELINDEDEVLLSYAENLGKMLDSVGGPSKALHLLKPLEELCSVEEGTVRTQAVKSVGQILSTIDAAGLEPDLVAMTKRLFNEEWLTSHNSGTLLIAHFYPLLSRDGQDELMSLFMKAVQHENNSVRKTAAEVLNSLIPQIPKAPEAELLNVL